MSDSSRTESPVPVWEKIATFAFGVVFVIALLGLAIFFPKPTPFQYEVFRIVLALACAGVAAIIPGFLAVRTDIAGMLIRASGALAVFVLVYLQSPAQLVAPTGSKPEPPPVVSQTLGGAVWDETNEPLAGVTVMLPAFDLTATTDTLGRFRFTNLRAPRQASVELVARKDGFRTYDGYATLGNPALSFTLKKAP